MKKRQRRREYFRPNVGMIVAHPTAPKVLWCRRRGGKFWQFPQGGKFWQFPQGGIDKGESPEQAAWRELQEETGLTQAHALPLASTKGWHRYRLPRSKRMGIFVGQRQRWFLYQMSAADEAAIRLDACRNPEFDQWQWVSYWYPVGQIVDFKREVYRRAMLELAPAFWSTFACGGGDQGENS